MALTEVDIGINLRQFGGILYPVPESEITIAPFQIPEHWPSQRFRPRTGESAESSSPPDAIV